MFGIFKSLFGKPVDYRKLMAEGAVIVDVRTPSEYKSGHIPGALNIPLDSIKSKSGDLKSKNKVVITCCRSGARSGMAKSILTYAGIETVNGGPWNSLIQKIR
jgi:rhodanese-related sulfurtransferase